MSLSIINSKTSNGILNFEIKSNVDNPIDKSIINGIRRTILNDIPAVGIQQENIHINHNETSLHNEFMKHRISLIPLNIDPTTYDNDYLLVLDVENKTSQIKTITTNDFKIHHLKKENIGKEDLALSKDNYDLDKEIDSKLKKKILRPFIIEDITSYIIITELKNTNSETEFQHLQLYLFPTIGTGKTNALFNNIPQCSYSFTESPKLLKLALTNELKIKNIAKEEKETFEREFTNAYKQRYYYRNHDNEPYWYNFVIKSNHYFNSKEIFINSMNILIDRLNRCNENLKLITIEPEKSRYSVTIEKNNALHFILEDENDTIGNILQSHIVNNITDDTLITFCGYKKIHPLEEKIKLVIFNKLLNDIDELSIISKVIFSISDNIDEIVNILEEIIEKSKSI